MQRLYPIRHANHPAACGIRLPETHIRVLSAVAVCMAALLISGCSPSVHDLIARGKLKPAAAAIARNPSLVESRDGKEKTPMHKAVTYKQIEAMEMLAGHGADVNARDITGMTPLHVAAMLGRQEEAQWLLEHGANPLIEDDYGDTPLHTAAIFGHGQIIGLLARQGVATDLPNANGETPRDIALHFRQERVAAFLLRLQGRPGQG